MINLQKSSNKLIQSNILKNKPSEILTKSEARKAKLEARNSKKKLAWKELVEATYEGNYNRVWRDETLRNLKDKIAQRRARILYIDYQRNLVLTPKHVRKDMKTEKKTLVYEIDAFTLDIDFIKNDLAHIYKLKTKFERDYTRPLPMHLF